MMMGGMIGVEVVAVGLGLDGSSGHFGLPAVAEKRMTEVEIEIEEVGIVGAEMMGSAEWWLGA